MQSDTYFQSGGETTQPCAHSHGRNRRSLVIFTVLRVNRNYNRPAIGPYVPMVGSGWYRLAWEEEALSV